MLQDMELIEVLWKQDVDMGFTVEALQAQSQQAQQGAAESATLTKPAPDPDPKANSSLSDLLVEPLDKVNTLDHGLGQVHTAQMGPSEDFDCFWLVRDE